MNCKHARMSGYHMVYCHAPATVGEFCKKHASEAKAKIARRAAVEAKNAEKWATNKRRSDALLALFEAAEVLSETPSPEVAEFLKAYRAVRPHLTIKVL